MNFALVFYDACLRTEFKWLRNDAGGCIEVNSLAAHASSVRLFLLVTYRFLVCALTSLVKILWRMRGLVVAIVRLLLGGRDDFRCLCSRRWEFHLRTSGTT
jgi:hypothetical protein